jgi:hypothetical protein
MLANDLTEPKSFGKQVVFLIWYVNHIGPIIALLLAISLTSNSTGIVTNNISKDRKVTVKGS